MINVAPISQRTSEVIERENQGAMDIQAESHGCASLSSGWRGLSRLVRLPSPHYPGKTARLASPGNEGAGCAPAPAPPQHPLALLATHTDLPVFQSTA